MFKYLLAITILISTLPAQANTCVNISRLLPANHLNYSEKIDCNKRKSHYKCRQVANNDKR